MIDVINNHALLGASSSERWIACPPSARLTEIYPDSQSDYAAEGSRAHEAAEIKLRRYLRLTRKKPICDDAEMDEATDLYVQFINEIYEEAKQTCKDPLLLTEQKVNFNRFVPEGFGTADVILISDGVMHLVDLKYGKGVPVFSESNPQLKLYCLGALEMLGHLYDIEVVRMTIFQPRLNNISTSEITVESLYTWVEEELKPKAQQAFDGTGEFQTGDHCRFCRAKAECRARAQANLELAAHDFIEPALLDNDEIAVILGQVDELVSWAGDIKDYALTEALKGVRFDGWKIVEGRSNRKYTDEIAVAETVTGVGLDPFKHELLGITAMTSLLGKKRFEDILGGFIEKPAGKPVLVQDSDKRQELTITSAADDFADQEN